MTGQKDDLKDSYSKLMKKRKRQETEEEKNNKEYLKTRIDLLERLEKCINNINATHLNLKVNLRSRREGLFHFSELLIKLEVQEAMKKMDDVSNQKKIEFNKLETSETYEKVAESLGVQEFEKYFVKYWLFKAEDYNKLTRYTIPEKELFVKYMKLAGADMYLQVQKRGYKQADYVTRFAVMGDVDEYSIKNIFNDLRPNTQTLVLKHLAESEKDISTLIEDIKCLDFSLTKLTQKSLKCILEYAKNVKILIFSKNNLGKVHHNVLDKFKTENPNVIINII